MRCCPLQRYSRRALPLALLVGLGGGTAAGQSERAAQAAQASSYDLRSPDDRIEIRVRTANGIRFDVLLKGRPLLQDCTALMDIEHKQLGAAGAKVSGSKERSYDQVVEPAVRQKFAKIRENYRELRLDMDGGYAVVFRAYNEGAAYRFETSLPGKQVKVYGEEMHLNFTGDQIVYYPQEDSFFSHNERKYLPQHLSEIAPEFKATLPAVVDVGEGAKLAIAESDIEDYPGLWLRGTGGNGLAAIFPPYPLKETLEKDRDFRVTESADYIAVTAGTRTFPWRLMGVAEKDGDLLTNQLVWLLEKPSQVADTSWIKPGKVAWDWWNANNIYGVDFKSGVNTATYKYYIDFAAKYGLQYIILDEGWYKLGNLMEVNPDINMEELSAYAKQKNVGIILVGGVEDARRSTAARARSVLQMGHRGHQGGFHAARRPAGGEFLPQGEPRNRPAQNAGGFSWRAEARVDDPHLAEPDQQRRRSRNGMEQVEQGRRAGAQRDAAFHAHVSGADGLHAGSDAERFERKFLAHPQSPHESGHALPPAGHVRGVRKSAGNAGGQPFELSARTGGDGVSRAYSVGVGRHARAGCAHRGLRGGGAQKRARLVCGRDDRLDCAGIGD